MKRTASRSDAHASAVGRSVGAAAVCKFLTLFLVVVKLVLPSLGLAEKQVAMMSTMFSWPQLVTAAIGGVLALLVVPALKKAFKD